MRKRCAKCQALKPIAAFHRKGTGHQAWCKSCSSAYTTHHYQLNKPRRIEQRKRRNDEFRRWYTSLKQGKPCVDCGLTFHPAAMQWDHLPGSVKDRPLAELCRIGNAERILREITQCELVCANCHAVRTYQRRQRRASAATDVSG